MSTDKFFDDNLRIIDSLASEFSGHIVNIDSSRIRSWIRQFSPEHYPIALKLLQNVNYFSPSKIPKELLTLFEQLKVTNPKPFHNTYYSSLGSVGSGSDNLIPAFRYVTKTKSHDYDSRYIRVSEIAKKLADKRNVSLVLLEDFAGTGDTTIENWEMISDAIPSEIEVILLLIGGFNDAIERIEKETRLNVVPSIRFDDSSRAFHNSNANFAKDEKEIVRKYCHNYAPKGFEEGYKNTQSLTIFHYRTSNNVIPILWCKTDKWWGLFAR